MFGKKFGLITAAVGVVLVILSCVLGFVVIPNLINNLIVNEVVLIEDSIQLERFEQVPFPLNFTVRIWNISNSAETLEGAVPVLTEVGPYVYKLYQSRVVDSKEEDHLTYRRVDRFEFDPEASFPNTEEDLVTIVNVPYNAILQVAERNFPNLMGILGTALNDVFGQYNSPIAEMRVRDLLFDGIPVCQNPGLIGRVACTQIRQLGVDAQNLAEQEDGSMLFSLLSFKDGTPSGQYVVNRGIESHTKLGLIALFEQLPHLMNWIDDGDQPGVCNMVNGTDSGIFPPFVDIDAPLYAMNTDICRSVELRYQYDTEYASIPVARFSANEWFLDNDEGCFCLRVTQSDVCLLRGAMEIYTCVGAFLVLSYPHFLYADLAYRNGVFGMNPEEEIHRIFLDLEPNTGTVIRGAKRAQFNIFLRPVSGIASTQSLRNSLTPIVWFEEGMSLPEEFVDEVKTKLLSPLTLVQIIVPVIISVFCVVLLSGVALIARAILRTDDSK